MAEYIEGKRAVLEAFKTNVPATCLYVAEGSHGDKNVSELVKRAHKMGLSVKQGETMVIRCDGAQEEQTAQELQEFLREFL